MLFIWEPNLAYLACHYLLKIAFLGSDVRSHKDGLVRKKKLVNKRYCPLKKN